MCAVLVGGMDRLHRKYVETAAALDVTLKVFHGQERSIEKQLGGADALILCADKVSHSARREVIKHAGSKNIPVFTMRSAGVCALRCCLQDCCGCSGYKNK
jgi:hypothetical protein